MPVYQSMYLLGSERGNWQKAGLSMGNSQPTDWALTQWQYPVCTAMVLSAQSGTGCRHMPLSAPSTGEVGSWKHWVQGRQKRKLFIQGISFCLAQQPYVQMGPRAKRDMFQFQSCSCESLITTRTGERLWIYIHTASFRNWPQNKYRETEKMFETNIQKK